jgi:hypothetical protein
MKKNNFYALLVLLYLLPLSLLAQDNKNVLQKMFSLPVLDVVDITCSGNEIFISTTDSLIVVSKRGKIMNKKQTGFNKSVYLDSKRYVVEKNIVVDESNNVVFDLTNELDKGKKVMKYLAKSENHFFTCIIDTPKVSYSSRIARIDNDNNSTSFAFLVGQPSGLFSDGEFLWYLYNKSSEEENGMLRKYDAISGQLISEIEIPIKSPVGLHIKNNQILTYSNHSGIFYQLTIGE